MAYVLSLRRVSSILLTFVLPACASEPPNVFTYGPSDGSGTAAPAVAAESPESVASSMRDDLQCSREVSKLSSEASQTERAWQLLRACAAMDKFRDLKLALRPTFSGKVRALGAEESARFLTQLIAIRGANFRRDLKVIQAEGFSIHALEPACEEPDRHRGKLVTFHAVALGDGSSASSVKFAEIDKVTEDLYAHGDSDLAQGTAQSEAGRRSNPKDRSGQVWIKAGSQSSGYLTGRTVIANVDGALRRRLSSNNEYVLVGVLQSVRRLVVEGEPTQEARVVLIDAFPPGVETPEF
jgi:hypothetical protein